MSETRNSGEVSIASSDWLGRRVICPSAPKFARRRYKGSGWIGEVIDSYGETVRVAFKGTPAKRWFHISHLTLLSPNDNHEAEEPKERL